MLKARGSGKTGCGSSPKTRPENQRLVGGVRPSARRMAGSGASATSGSCSTRGSTTEAGSGRPALGQRVGRLRAGRRREWSSPLHAAVRQRHEGDQDADPALSRPHRTPTRCRNCRSVSVGPARMPSSCSVSVTATGEPGWENAE